MYRPEEKKGRKRKWMTHNNNNNYNIRKKRDEREKIDKNWGTKQNVL